MNDEIPVDHDRLHHIPFDPHEIVICIRCLLTLHYLISLIRVTSCLNKGWSYTIIKNTAQLHFSKCDHTTLIAVKQPCHADHDVYYICISNPMAQ